MYFIRATQEITWNSQALTEQPDSSLLTRFFILKFKVFLVRARLSHPQACAHMALCGLCEGLNSDCLDLQAARWQEISLYQDVPFEDYFHAIVMMTSTCGGQVGGAEGAEAAPWLEVGFGNASMGLEG